MESEIKALPGVLIGFWIPFFMGAPMDVPITLTEGCIFGVGMVALHRFIAKG